MPRTRSEAEAIVREKYIGIDPHNAAVLINYIQRTQEWACENCFKVGTVFKVNGSIKTADCICKVIRRKKLLVEKLKADSNFPVHYHNADFKKWINVGRTKTEVEINQKNIEIAEKYSMSFPKMLKKGYGLYLTGPNGVGKTYVACAVANRAMALGYDVKYYTMSVIIQTEIRGWRDPESAEVMRCIKQTTLLVIDDLDKIYKTSTGIERSLFDNILRERLQSNRPCIFTSNRTVADAKNDFNEHIASMLIEHCAELVFLGKDHRQDLSEAIRKEIVNGDS